jgi:hypothetical protein
VRQQARPGPERADLEVAAGGKRVQGVAVVQHPRPVEREHRVERAGQRVHRQRRRRVGAQRSRTQQRVEVGAVVGMSVADEHGVDVLGGRSALQPLHGSVAGVEQQPEPVVLHEVAAARLVGRRPGAAATEHRDAHPDDRTAGLATLRTCCEPANMR